MLLLVLIFSLCFLIIWWAYAGYVFFLMIYRVLRRGFETKKVEPEEWPSIAVLIPVKNEEKWVSGKLSNLMLVDYPFDKMKIIFVDGGSDDRTLEVLEEEIRRQKQDHAGIDISVEVSDKPGKVNQINYLVERIDSDVQYMVVSDVDTELSKNVLKEMVREFLSNEKVGVVGAYVCPKNATWVEMNFWKGQNLLRILESYVHSASTVIAPCYAFTRKLFHKIPEDCVADDLYMTYYANSKGYTAAYQNHKKGIVRELRVPRNMLEFMSHKFRKANANLREILRFLYLLPSYNIRWKLIYVTKVIQMLVLPPVQLLFVLITLNFMVTTLPYILFTGYVYVFLVLSMFVGHLILSRSERTTQYKTASFPMVLVLFFSLNMIIFFTPICYLFFNQDSIYKKVSE